MATVDYGSFQPTKPPLSALKLFILSQERERKERKSSEVEGLFCFLSLFFFSSSLLPPACAKRSYALGSNAHKALMSPLLPPPPPPPPLLSLLMARLGHSLSRKHGWFPEGLFFFFFFFNLSKIQHRQQQLGSVPTKKTMRGGFTLGTIGSESLQAVN